MNNKFYTVRPDGSGIFVIIDAKTGNTVNRFNLPGILVNGPVISGDTCSIMVRHNNVQTGYIIKLPAGNIINRFSG